jgi:hypothetical protein
MCEPVHTRLGFVRRCETGASIASATQPPEGKLPIDSNGGGLSQRDDFGNSCLSAPPDNVSIPR